MTRDILMESELPQQRQYVVFVIDSSGSMSVNGHMNALNEAMEIVLFLLGNYVDMHPEKDIKVSILTYGSVPKWIIFDPESPSNLFFNYLEAHGGTYFGDALLELEKLFDRINPQMQADNTTMTIVFTADGFPGGPFNPWEECFAKIKDSDIYMNAKKYAIAIGEDFQSFSDEYLAILTGDRKLVFPAPSPAEIIVQLKRITDIIIGVH